MDDKLTIMLDASGLSESACGLRLFNTIIAGYKQKLNYNDMEFGTAFHKFRAKFKEHGEDGIAAGIIEAKKHYEETPMLWKSQKKYMTREYLVNACVLYATTYADDDYTPVEINGEKAIELKFAIDYYSDDKVDLILSGTIDDVSKMRNGPYTIIDAKTTSVWDKTTYFNGYNLSPQLFFYRLAIAEYAKRAPNSVFGEMQQTEVAIVIDGIFCSGKDKPVDLKRSIPIIIKEDTLAEFKILVDRKVQRVVDIAHAWLDKGEKPLREGMVNGACEGKFGACKFFPACSGVDAWCREEMMSRLYVKRFYNPLEFQL